MKFFKPEDFEIDLRKESTWYPLLRSSDAFIMNCAKRISDFCNEKIEREGKVLEGCLSMGEFHIKQGASDCHLAKPITHTALLINIETIEPCTHPPEKVKGSSGFYQDKSLAGVVYKCECCGAFVKPASFEVISE